MRWGGEIRKSAWLLESHTVGAREAKSRNQDAKNIHLIFWNICETLNGSNGLPALRQEKFGGLELMGLNLGSLFSQKHILRFKRGPGFTHTVAKRLP